MRANAPFLLRVVNGALANATTLAKKFYFCDLARKNHRLFCVISLKCNAYRIWFGVNPHSIEQDILAQQGELQGSLRIASNSSFGSTHLLLAIKDFLQHHPKLNIQFQLSDQSVNLIDERIDLAIRFTNQPDPNLIARPLATCHSLLVASPEYLAQKGVPQTPQDLAAHIYLAHANINRKEWKFYQNECEISLELTSQFTTNDTGALLNLTLAGGGIAMLPKYLLNEHLASQQLVPILTDWQLPTYQIYALYSSRHKLPLTIRTLVDFLVERFRGVNW